METSDEFAAQKVDGNLWLLLCVKTICSPNNILASVIQLQLKCKGHDANIAAYSGSHSKWFCIPNLQYFISTHMIVALTTHVVGWGKLLLYRRQLFLSWQLIYGTSTIIVNTLGQIQHGRHFTDYIFESIFENENVWISITISLKSLYKSHINNISALQQIMAWRRPQATRDYWNQ